MKQHGKIGWIALVLFLVACWWGAAARAERMPVDFVTVSKEHLDVTASGSGRLQLSWEFTAETESLSLDREAKDAAIITVFYEVRLYNHGNTLAAVIPGAAGDTDSLDAESSAGATIFLNDEDFLVIVPVGYQRGGGVRGPDGGRLIPQAVAAQGSDADY